MSPRPRYKPAFRVLTPEGYFWLDRGRMRFTDDLRLASHVESLAHARLALDLLGYDGPYTLEEVSP